MPLNSDLLERIKRDLVVSAVVKLARAGTLCAALVSAIAIGERVYE
jgi:hypothetical protein